MIIYVENSSRELVPLHATLAATFVNADFVVRHTERYFAERILSLFKLKTCFHTRNLRPSLAIAQLLDCCTKFLGRVSFHFLKE